MKKAVGYCRYSTANQHETSIASQIRAITTFCDNNRMELVDVYTDEAKSGTNTNRPGFQRMLQDAHAYKMDAIIIYDISRGSRDVVDWFQFRRDMRALGIDVCSATERLGDVSDPSSFLTEAVTVAMGQTFVLQSRQKSIDARRIRAERGLFNGGNAPLGYRIENGKYIVVQEEAAAIAEAFRMYADGKSYKKICAMFAARGIRGKGGQIIGDNTLYFILGNERYTGKYVWFARTERYMHKHVGKANADPIVIDGVIPRIIDDATWQAVQLRRVRNKANKTNHGKREYLLSGLMRCADCGATYIGITTTSKGCEYKYYACNNKFRLHTCKAKNIKADIVEKRIVELFRTVVLNPDLIADVAKYIVDQAADHCDDGAQTIRNQITGLEKATENLWEAIEGGLKSSRTYARIDENERKIAELRRKLDSLQTFYKPNTETICEILREDAKNLAEDEIFLSAILRKYILGIEVGEKSIYVHTLIDQTMPKNAITDLGIAPKSVTTIGSPGTHCGVVTYVIPRAA